MKVSTVLLIPFAIVLTLAVMTLSVISLVAAGIKHVSDNTIEFLAGL